MIADAFSYRENIDHTTEHWPVGNEGLTDRGSGGASGPRPAERSDIVPPGQGGGR